ncbi:hypothetical protein NDU88_003656 [Pleurodeles waltl]|uniref:Uncharacterized protein n=1 Tax=Pleurodeles waltl TaxID=8319 RepID=A0AAV7TQC1_PLEWA|nr:hypothetical protein NDU88_003656 [Pleurodeles waltl]
MTRGLRGLHPPVEPEAAHKKPCIPSTGGNTAELRPLTVSGGPLCQPKEAEHAAADLVSPNADRGRTGRISWDLTPDVAAASLITTQSIPSERRKVVFKQRRNEAERQDTKYSDSVLALQRDTKTRQDLHSR